MRELISTKMTSEPGVIKSVYRSELVYCTECKKTVPIGIEVVTIRKDADTQKVLKRQFLCRVHGVEYESMAPRKLADGDTKRKADNDTFLRNYSKMR